MPSRRITTTLSGVNAEAVEEYRDKHECSGSEAVQEFVDAGRRAREEDRADQTLTDGGIPQPTEQDWLLERITESSAVGIIVAALLWVAMDAPDMMGAIVFFAVVALVAGISRQIRERDRMSEVEDGN